MPHIRRSCSIFDPVKITTATRIDSFLVDTWHEHGLISNRLCDKLPGVDVGPSGPVMLSSSMKIDRPTVRVGIQIGAVRMLPVTLNVVDDGPAPLLLGADFVMRLFDLGMADDDPGKGDTFDSLEPPAKYLPESLGIRIVPTGKTVDALQFEEFMRGLREIHNVGVLAHSHLHQHENFRDQESKASSIRATITRDQGMSEDQILRLSWIGHGSIWVSVTSGAKAALSWITQIFQKSMDARMRATISNAAAAEEEAAIRSMARKEIAAAKAWEHNRLSARLIRETREEWRKNVIAEINFNKKLAEQIKDDMVRLEAEARLDSAIRALIESDLLPIVEQIPAGYAEWRDPLPVGQKEDDPGPQTPPRLRGR